MRRPVVALLAAVAVVAGGSFAAAAENGSAAPVTVTTLGSPTELQTCPADVWCGTDLVSLADDPTGYGSGALRFDTAGADDKATVWTEEVAGTRLSEIESLSYRTRVESATPTVGLTPTLFLEVGTARKPAPDPEPESPVATRTVTLVFEPQYAVGAQGVRAEWQTWQPMTQAGWWSPQNKKGELGFPQYTTLRQVRESLIDGVIFRFAINQGSGNAGLVAFADLARFNDTTYDFDPPAPSRVVVTASHIDAADGPEDSIRDACLTRTRTWCEYERATGTVSIARDPQAPGGAALTFRTPTTTSKATLTNRVPAVSTLADVALLRYRTYWAGPGPDQVTNTTPGPELMKLTTRVAINLPIRLSDTRTATLVWEPNLCDRDAVVRPHAWQDWTPSDQCGWWSPANANGALGFPQKTATFDEVKASLPEAVLLGIGLNQGSGNPGVVSSVDLLQVNGTLFDFQSEPGAGPDAAIKDAAATVTGQLASASPSASPSVSPSTSPSASPSVSPSTESPAPQTSPTSSTGPADNGGSSGGSTSGGSGSGGTVTTQSSASPSSEPGGSSTGGSSTGGSSTGGPSPTASSPSAESVCAIPQVRVNTPTINATGIGSVTVFGVTPNSRVELFAYSQNHYGTATFGSAPARVATADGNGAVSFSDLRPSANTRLKARQVGCGFGESAVMSVRTQLTLAVTRTGTRTYRFSGDSIPARDGGLIVGIYRVTPSGEKLVGQARADALNGEWTRTITFPAKDANAPAQFVLKTGRDAQNVPGQSNVRALQIR